MKAFTVRKTHLLTAMLVLVGCILLQQLPAAASPFGSGVFGAQVPFGSATSIGISLSGAVSMSLTPSGGYFSGNGSHTITVTSTDVVGYDLYINSATSTALSDGTHTIAASSNSTPGALAVNTWGYNNTGSTTNFIGPTLSTVSLKSATGPFESGDNTTVTYGVYTDLNQAASTYTNNITYTAIGQS